MLVDLGQYFCWRSHDMCMQSITLIGTVCMLLCATMHPV